MSSMEPTSCWITSQEPVRVDIEPEETNTKCEGDHGLPPAALELVFLLILISLATPGLNVSMTAVVSCSIVAIAQTIE